ncbi:methyltransferase domain-containing protein [Aquitalea palustris]|uniref:Methyltransferase domain-containing protein n=1 Tax=Aquitalea palustris TaxID=2480983 RepID=A0A454JL79_9NEIS|nr:methyltransferase domain-containing protein [Aquitalea palustris]RMD00210.1 methyltransferase domain-containing protein [Aquitalea palustris]
MELARQWLQGKGVELGRGAHNPLAPADCISVAPCDGVNYVDERDLADYRVYVQEQQRHGRGVDQVDVVADATVLPFAAGELDYIASSHVLEHVPDIFSAWLEWGRVLREGGISFMIVPKRDALVEDSVRPITGLDAHIEAFQHKMTPQSLSPGLPWRTHYHVFTLQGLFAALNWFNQQGLGVSWLLEAQEESDSKVGNGHTLVLSKQHTLPPLEESIGQLGAAFQSERYAEAVLLARQALSLNFRIHEAWFILAMSQLQLGDSRAAVQSLTQALVLQPKHVEYRNMYQQLLGQPFSYPLSLVDYLARLL